MASRKFVRRPKKWCPPHCIIWAGQDGKMKLLCAHCEAYSGGEFNLRATYTEEELRAAVRGSQKGHARMCVRLPK